MRRDPAPPLQGMPPSPLPRQETDEKMKCAAQPRTNETSQIFVVRWHVIGLLGPRHLDGVQPERRPHG